jgi:hypothetical protein
MNPPFNHAELNNGKHEHDQEQDDGECRGNAVLIIKVECTVNQVNQEVG